MARTGRESELEAQAARQMLVGAVVVIVGLVALGLHRADQLRESRILAEEKAAGVERIKLPRGRYTPPGGWVKEKSVTSPNKGKKLMGPASLRDALRMSDPNTLGTRMVVSVPNGDCVAILHAGGEIEGFRLPERTGHGGSVEGTGRVLTLAELERKSWRPATMTPKPAE